MQNREEREKREREEYERLNPKISHQFADAKRALASVTEEEWASIPEAGDYTGRNKRARRERMQRAYAVPDSVLAAARSAGEKSIFYQLEPARKTNQPEGEMDTSIDIASDNTRSASNASQTNFGNIGTARTNLLAAKLAQAEKEAAAATKVGNGTSIDKNAMMTALGAKELAEGMINIYDVKRTRPLLESVTKANPKHAPGWISLARLEEHAKNIVTARSKILEGCSNCPKNEDVWLEAVRLHKEGDNHNSKVIVYDALQHCPKSWRLWFAAMELEPDITKKKKILRKAVDNIPNSAVLWKAFINLEEPKNAKGIIQKALQYIPQSIELWIALAQLESPEEARKVINSARQKLPTSHEIWVAAARLEESANNPDRIPVVMSRAVQVLQHMSAQIKREDWLKEAYAAEEDGSPLTCKAVVEAIRDWNLTDGESNQVTWLAEAAAAKESGHYTTARAYYKMMCAGNTKDVELWDAAVALEEEHGTKEQLYDVLQQATTNMPHVDKYWLQLANDKWENDPEAARIVLVAAFARNRSESVFLASVDLEIAAKEYDRARQILRAARETAPSDRLWTYGVTFERNMGNEDEAFHLLTEGLEEFPRSGKMWIIKGQIYEAKGMLAQAREAYNTGTRQAPKFVPLWLAACRVEQKIGTLIKARSILERGRKENPKTELLWLEAIRLELKADNKVAAENLMGLALKDVPNSGVLLAEKVLKLEERTKKKARALDAMRKVPGDKHITGAVARLFWSERQIEKANKWFENAIEADPDWGDSWAWYYKFLLQHGTEERIREVAEQCAETKPSYGEVWPRIRKDPKNYFKSDKEILRMVAKELHQ